MERPADRAGRLDPTIHLTIELNEEYGLLWWIIGEPDGPGYCASGLGEQSITVLPKSRAVIVYLSNMQPDSEITEAAMKPLDNVLFTAFR